MGASWQTQDQKDLIAEHLPSYFQHSEDGSLKTTFWPNFFEKWFKIWPIPEPSVVEEEGDAQSAIKAERAKKITVSAEYLR